MTSDIFKKLKNLKIGHTFSDQNTSGSSNHWTTWKKLKNGEVKTFIGDTKDHSINKSKQS